jgi:hypothetical protein
MKDMKQVLKRALAIRLERASTEDAEELAEQLADLPAADFAEMLALARGAATETPAPLPVARPNMSLKEALVEVMRATERPLTSNEIVARVIAVRPGSPDPSIRSEISRARKLGAIVLRGDPRGGTYTIAPVARSTRAPLT